MSHIDIKKQYEYYLTYDKPIPFIPSEINNYKEEITNRYNFLLQELKNNDSIDEKIIKELTNLELKLKNCTLYIYPVTKIDEFDFLISSQCIQIDKNKIPDIKIIKMSYLDYLFHLIENDSDGAIYARMLVELIKLTFKVEENEIKNRKDLSGNNQLIIKDIPINKSDFDLIMKIILNQNIINYSDEYIDPDFEKMIKEVEDIESRNFKTPTLEEQLVCVCLCTPYKIEELYNLTLRKFSLLLKKADAKMHYLIYKTGEASGMVQYKEEIQHWIYGKEKDRFAGKFIDYDNLQSNLNPLG